MFIMMLCDNTWGVEDPDDGEVVIFPSFVHAFEYFILVTRESYDYD